MDSKKIIRAMIIIGVVAAILGIATGLLIVKFKPKNNVPQATTKTHYETKQN